MALAITGLDCLEIDTKTSAPWPWELRHLCGGVHDLLPSVHDLLGKEMFRTCCRRVNHRDTMRVRLCPPTCVRDRR